MTGPFGEWEAHSRELLLRCAPDGTVRAADARALRLLGLGKGEDLRSRAAPGTADKLLGLLSRAAASPVRDWELALVFGEEVHSVTFTAVPAPVGEGEGQGEVVLLGQLPPGVYARALDEAQDAMAELAALHRELSRQQRELEESNRGILALHAELQEKAEALRRTADVRARLVAHVSHEFRTPLHTILGLSRLLLDRIDGPLLPEQEKQVSFIKSSADELVEFVNDLLDLSRAESGKTPLRVERQTLGELFGALRGMLRPLVPANAQVELCFEDPPEDVEVETDLGKVSQVVRNLVSNALKFTPKGEVRVFAQVSGGRLALSVRDTGVGIRKEDLPHIFADWGQVEGPLQSTLRGTGLGLPLSRRLAELLGGGLHVESTPGQGSTFRLDLPLRHPGASEVAALKAQPVDPSRAQLLVVEDDREALVGYEQFFAPWGYQVLPARSVKEAREALGGTRPKAVLLDVMLEGEDSWALLADLKADPKTRGIPVLVVTLYNAEKKARSLGADAFWLKPVDRDVLLQTLQRLVPAAPPPEGR